MVKIVISYRRQDSDAITGRIRDRLASEYGADAVFMDIDSIPFGVDFREYISGALKHTDALIAVIGPYWVADRQGNNRIMDADDPVRIEIERAFENKIRIWPVLVGGASMPAASTLPASIQKLADYNAADVEAGRDFHRDVDRLIGQLNVSLGRATVWGAVKARAARVGWRYTAMLAVLAAGVTIFAYVRPGADTQFSALETGAISSEAKTVNCGDEPKLHALENASPTLIRFTNKSGEVRQIFWLDRAGKRVFYSQLQNGQSYVQKTFVTHPWLVADSAGECLAIFMPATTAAAAVLKP